MWLSIIKEGESHQRLAVLASGKILRVAKTHCATYYSHIIDCCKE